MAGVVCAVLSVIALINRKVLNTLLTLSVINSCWYFTLATVFYGLEIKYQWIIAAAVGNSVTNLAVIEIVLCAVLVRQKYKIIAVVVLFIIPVIFALLADGIIKDLSWKSPSLEEIVTHYLLTLHLPFRYVVYLLALHLAYHTLHP